MNRFIVVNPEIAAIQGDIMCASAAAAVSRLEAHLTLDTDNASWDVYVAPAAFPASGASYDGLDAGLVAMLAAARPVLSAPNQRRAASLAMVG